MKTQDFYFKLLSSIKNRKDIDVRKYKLKYQNSEYDFLRIVSKEIEPNDKIILIRAGIHGDEIAGPLTILSFCNGIIDYIHRAGLKCIIYPLGNPSGFEFGTRYNEDYQPGDPYNNDFLRYELEGEIIVTSISEGSQFKKWHWLSDVAKELKIKLPAETKLMQKLLKKDLLSKIAAFLDLHQDHDFTAQNMAPGAYHYSFGNLSSYESIVERIKKILPLSCGVIGTDEQGFIIEHDGSLDDLMYRLGVEYSVTCETTGATPLEVAKKVNLIWIFGIVDLVRHAKFSD